MTPPHNLNDAAAGAGDAAASVQARFEHATSQLAFWRAMSTRIDRDKLQLRWVLPVGLGLAAVAGLVTGDWRVAGLLFALAATVATMGQYFTRVRAAEYRYNVAEAEEALAGARRAAADAAPPGPGPTVKG